MLFEKLYDLLEPPVAAAGPAHLPDRRHRHLHGANPQAPARPSNRTSPPTTWGELIEAYNHHYYHYDDGSPLLVVDSRNLDFEHKPTDFEELLHHISRQIRGTEYLRARPAAPERTT